MARTPLRAEPAQVGPTPSICKMEAPRLGLMASTGQCPSPRGRSSRRIWSITKSRCRRTQLALSTCWTAPRLISRSWNASVGKCRARQRTVGTVVGTVVGVVIGGVEGVLGVDQHYYY